MMEFCHMIIAGVMVDNVCSLMDIIVEFFIKHFLINIKGM